MALGAKSLHFIYLYTFTENPSDGQVLYIFPPIAHFLRGTCLQSWRSEHIKPKKYYFYFQRVKEGNKMFVIKSWFLESKACIAHGWIDGPISECRVTYIPGRNIICVNRGPIVKQYHASQHGNILQNKRTLKLNSKMLNLPHCTTLIY